MKRTLLLILALLVAAPGVHAQELDDFAKAKRQYEEALFLYEAEAYRDALETFLQSQQLNSRSSTVLYIARCYRQLKLTKHALYYYRRYMPTYRAEERGAPPPAEVQLEIREQISRLKAKLAAKREAKAARAREAQARTTPARPAAPPPRDDEAARGIGPVRWLAPAVGAGVLAVGFEIAAWISLAQGDGLYTDDPALQKHRDMVAAGHILAGLLAVTSGVSFYFWHKGRTRSSSAASVWLAPVPGGASLGGVF